MLGISVKVPKSIGLVVGFACWGLRRWELLFHSTDPHRRHCHHILLSRLLLDETSDDLLLFDLLCELCLHFHKLFEGNISVVLHCFLLGISPELLIVSRLLFLELLSLLVEWNLLDRLPFTKNVEHGINRWPIAGVWC